MASPSPTYRLAEVLLGEPLDQWVKQLRRDGASWRLIAMELWRATNHEVVVSFETLRTWFPDDQNGGEGEAA